MSASALCSCRCDLVLRSHFPWSLCPSSGSGQWGGHPSVLAVPTVIIHQPRPCNNHRPLTSVMLLPTSCRDIINKNNEERWAEQQWAWAEHEQNWRWSCISRDVLWRNGQKGSHVFQCFKWLNEIKTFTTASVSSRYCCPVKYRRPTDHRIYWRSTEHNKITSSAGQLFGVPKTYLDVFCVCDSSEFVTCWWLKLKMICLTRFPWAEGDSRKMPQKRCTEYVLEINGLCFDIVNKMWKRYFSAVA